MNKNTRQNKVPEWVNWLPKNWQIKKLKSFAEVRFSNVDKLTIEDEEPIRLCNYTDVYYQNKITPDIDFMKATASKHEIEKFALRGGDVLITKDSEVPTDICVPSFVPNDIEGVICGYHLAQVRPNNDQVNSKFVYFAFSAYGVRDHFHFSANGITRYGLSQHAIKSAPFPIPPREEQNAIVAFLDRKLADIDQLIANKRRMIELLEEQRQRNIERLILGFDLGATQPSNLMKLNSFPKDWEEKRAKYYLAQIDIRTDSGQEELLSVSHLTGVTPRSQKNITMFKAESYEGYKLCEPGDLVVNTMWAFMAALGVSKYSGIVSYSYAVYRQHSNKAFLDEYLDALLRTTPYKAEYMCRSTGITSSRLRLYPEQLLRIPLICPPKDKQFEIVEQINGESKEILRTISNTEKEIELIEEFRTALIAEAVTGKIDLSKEVELVS